MPLGPLLVSTTASGSHARARAEKRGLNKKKRPQCVKRKRRPLPCIFTNLRMSNPYGAPSFKFEKTLPSISRGCEIKEKVRGLKMTCIFFMFLLCVHMYVYINIYTVYGLVLGGDIYISCHSRTEKRLEKTQKNTMFLVYPTSSDFKKIKPRQNCNQTTQKNWKKNILPVWMQHHHHIYRQIEIIVRFFVLFVVASFPRFSSWFVCFNIHISFLCFLLSPFLLSCFPHFFVSSLLRFFVLWSLIIFVDPLMM